MANYIEPTTLPRRLRYEMARSGVVHLKDTLGGPMLCGVRASGYAVNLTSREPTCEKCIALTKVQ